jgi:hypothetical protein
MMHSVSVSQNGVDLGTIKYRGITIAPAVSPGTRQFRCDPKKCVPKGIIRKIADRLAFGITAGHEDDYEWRT